MNLNLVHNAAQTITEEEESRSKSPPLNESAIGGDQENKEGQSNVTSIE